MRFIVVSRGDDAGGTADPAPGSLNKNGTGSGREPAYARSLFGRERLQGPGSEVAAFSPVLHVRNAGSRDSVSTSNEYTNPLDTPYRQPIAEQGQPVLPRGDVTAAEGPAFAEASAARPAFAEASADSPGFAKASAGLPGASAGGVHPYGPNNEEVPEELQNALRELVTQVAEESETARREEIRRVKQAHYFWRGLQYLWWNERDQNWHLPFEQKLTDQTSLEDMPRYEFVTNLYQAFGQSIVAVLSQSVPQVRFLPKSPSNEVDITTAKAATDVIELVERNNRIEQILAEESFHLWVGGKVGAYVRYVVDGQAFGWHPEPVIEAREKEIKPGRFLCQACGVEAPEDQVVRVAGDRWPVTGAGVMEAGEANSHEAHSLKTVLLPSGRQTDGARAGSEEAGGQEGTQPGMAVLLEGRERDRGRPVDSGMSGQTSARAGVPAQPGPDAAGGRAFCPECGALIDSGSWLPAELITVPEVTGTRNVPNGQEVVTVVGALELKTPPWANEQREYPYLQWQMETHLARLRAAYPHAAGRIGPPVAPDGSAQYERLARLSQSQGGPFTEGGDVNQNLVTYQRTWLRPWAFYLLEDLEKREKLLELFPEGCYVAFAGDAYLESRNESMDEHWRVMHSLPGDGSSSGRPALGDSLLSVQERFNTLTNMQMETYDYGVPPTYVDPEAIDVDATQYQTAEPGAIYPARPRPGMPLGASFFVPPPAQVPPDLVQHEQELMGPIAQFLTGAFPAIFGGSMEGQKTASGYAMARDQALGRLGLVWRRIRQFHADVMMLAVECFRKNRSADVEIPLFGAGMEFDSKWIRLADLRGSLVAYPESDEQFPTLWNQKRAVLMQLMGMKDPSIQQTLAMPENLTLVKQLLGLTELQVPGEESRTKQVREITVLLEGQPVARTDLQTGQVVVVPSLLPDGFADDHRVELETCKQWLNSDAGQAAKINNPDGWANVRAHAMMHEEFLRQQAAEQAAASAPEPKQPAESINFKDLPAEGQAQMAAQAGIRLDPAGLGGNGETAGE